MMRYLALALLLTGCALNTPISQFDDGIAELCTGGQHTYQGHTFTVVTLDSVDDLYTHCGTDARACTDGNTMWVPDGPACPRSVAHEMSHISGNHWVDAH